VDDYITGVEQVGVDPTDPVEAVVPVETQDKVDPGTDVYEFKEYDLKEYDNKESVDKAYDYGDYSPTDAKPPSETYEEEFGPGVPALSPPLHLSLHHTHLYPALHPGESEQTSAPPCLSAMLHHDVSQTRALQQTCFTPGEFLGQKHEFRCWQWKTEPGLADKTTTAKRSR